jgi:tetratricopeptide (TPR) repeat protein
MEAIHAGDFESDAFRRAADAGSPLAFLGRAVAHAEADRRREARTDALRALALAPASASVRILAARISCLLCDPLAAFEHLDKAEALAAGTSGVEWRAESAARLGWMSEAIRCIDAVARQKPAAAAPHDRATRILGEAGDLDGALHHLREAAARDPGSVDRCLREARLLIRLERLEEARTAARAALAMLPDSAALRVEAATLLMDADAIDEAEVLLHQALVQDPAIVQARLLLAQLRLWRGDARGATDAARNLLASDATIAAGHRILGAAHLLEGRWVEAIAPLDQSLAVDPRNAETLVWRAEARLRLGQFREAASDAMAGAEASEVYVVATIVRLAAVLRSGEHVRDFSDIHDVLDKVSPGAAAGLERESLDRILAVLDDCLRGLRGNRTASSLTFVADGSSQLRRLRTAPPPRRQLIEAQGRVEMAGFEATIRGFDRFFEKFPRSPLPACYRGELYLWSGDYEHARGDFELALRIKEPTRWAYIGLAAVDLMEGDPERSLATNAHGLQRMGGTTGPTLFAYRGEAYRRLGQLDRAIPDLETAVRDRPLRVGAWVNLALARHAAGDSQITREIWERLRHTAPAFTCESAREAEMVDDKDAPLESIVRALERGLVMLRGNRSSSCITWFNARNELRVRLHVVPFDENFVREEARSIREALERLAGTRQERPPK